MLPYESAIRIPTAEGIVIADTIDNRDEIIDKLLNRIHGKYIKLAEENTKIKNALDAQGISLDTLLQGEKIEGATIEKTIYDTINVIQDDKQVCQPFLNRED